MRRAVLVAAAVLLAGACARPSPGDPPAVKLGADACARCGMLVSEERYLGGWVEPDGRSVVFDDVGELRDELSRRPELVKVSFVRDASDGSWVRAAQAVFVRVDALPTPMGTGWAAFADQGRAEAFQRARAAAGR